MAMDTVTDNRRSSRPAGRLALIAAVGVAANAAAQLPAERARVDEPRTNFAVTLGGGHTDNVLQTGDDERSSSYTAPGFILDVARDTERLRIEADADIEYREYSMSAVRDDTWGTLNAEIELRAVPDRFSWFFNDNFGQGRPDSILASGPDNRDRVNIFTTGPAVYLPLGSRTEFRGSAFAGQRNYDQSSELEGDTLISSAGFFRSMSTTSEIGVGVSKREIEYPDSTFDNDIDIVYIAYEKTLASGFASVVIGSSEVNYANRTDDIPHINIGWFRDIGARSRLTLSLDNEFVDSGDEFRGGDSTIDQFLNLDVYERSSASLLWTVTGARTAMNLGVGIGEDLYQNATFLDNESIELEFSLRRDISTRSNFGISARMSELDFRLGTQLDDDSEFAVWYERQFGQQIRMNVQYQRDKRNSTLFTAFDENSLIFRMVYSLRGTTPLAAISR